MFKNQKSQYKYKKKIKANEKEKFNNIKKNFIFALLPNWLFKNNI